MASRPVTAVIVGAGHRSLGYGRYALEHPDEFRIVGLAEPNPVRRRQAMARFDLPPRQCFETAAELASRPAFADAVINGTMDRDHVPTTLPLLDAGYHVLLEKPMAPSREDLLQLVAAVERTGRRLMVCHVLRYAPFYAEVRRRIAAGEVGAVLHIHTGEHVSYHHMAAAFIRGKWGRREDSNPMLLAKCCHDLDLLCWMKSGVPPRQVASFGGLSYFRAENAPAGAGTRCLTDCSIEADCPFSARKNYIEQGRWGAYAWEPIEHLDAPTVEDKIESLRTDNPWGRCVWHCDNTVVDHQSVLLAFADGSTASHDMVGGTSRPCRKLHVLGTRGEIEGVMEEGRFVVRRPDARKGREYSEEHVDVNVRAGMHGGGDLRLVADFVRVVRGEKPSLSTTDIRDSVNGHLIAYAADEAMRTGTAVPVG
ncbi:MAG: Gfo/Idh/MocA family oxidoreductase [Kiritimatiellaeota bacterium]|nr:Gfo/Idh/MocA family oxidoreductase [Kiritimatiellota bacterium]